MEKTRSPHLYIGKKKTVAQSSCSNEYDISAPSLQPWCLSTPLIIGMFEIIQLSVSCSLMTLYASL